MFSRQLGGEQDLQLQPAEQFIERQLNADKKFTEIRVLRAYRIKTHFGEFFVGDRKSTRLNSSHVASSYAVFCLKKKSVAFMDHVPTVDPKVVPGAAAL